MFSLSVQRLVRSVVYRYIFVITLLKHTLTNQILFYLAHSDLAPEYVPFLFFFFGMEGELNRVYMVRAVEQMLTIKGPKNIKYFCSCNLLKSDLFLSTVSVPRDFFRQCRIQ